MPSNALDKETAISFMNLSTGFDEDVDRDVKSKERPTNATDMTAIFNWWVAVVWVDKKNFIKKTR